MGPEAERVAVEHRGRAIGRDAGSEADAEAVHAIRRIQ